MTIRDKMKVTTATLAFATTGMLATPALAQITHVGDVEIDGSLCVGFDCTGTTAFGFDTQVLKENNLRILFDDTSSSASFPNQDWRLIANDTSNGGAEHFTIEDATTGNDVFRVFAGARNNALVVDAQGDVGLGTTTPAVDIDIKTGNTPTVRLQQDGTSGFTPQSWDMAGNETNFFIRDVSNGSTLPFRIRPSAPTSAIDVAGDGDVGLGTSAPAHDLHIRDTGGSNDAVIAVEANGTIWEITSNAATGRMTYGITGGTDPFKMAPDAVENLLRVGVVANNRVDIAGSLFTTGSCSIGCDEVFDEAYDLPTIEEHAELMYANKHLPTVGPTESGPIDVTQKMIAMLNELEKAHIYIDQLNQRIEKLEAEK